ncbi:hypothetical protein G4B88_013011, partial [Cannabis sativa]
NQFVVDGSMVRAHILRLLRREMMIIAAMSKGSDPSRGLWLQKLIKIFPRMINFQTLFGCSIGFESFGLPSKIGKDFRGKMRIGVEFTHSLMIAINNVRDSVYIVGDSSYHTYVRGRQRTDPIRVRRHTSSILEMNANIEEALDSGPRVTLNLKRKRSTRCAAYFTGATRSELPQSPNSSRHGKRRKLKGCTSSGSHSRTSLLKCYLNFMRSGAPQRLMFHQNGKWTDFPEDLVEMVRKDVIAKKATSEIELHGRQYVLDFLHMFKVDLRSGFQQPIAWIDEAGSCFFPETFSNDAEDDNNDAGDDDNDALAESCGSRDFKLQVEIEINAVADTMLDECCGESNVLVKKIHVEHEPASNAFIVDAEDSCNREPTMKVECDEMEVKSLSIDESVNKKIDCDTVRNMFLVGMGGLGCVDIVDIHPCISSLMQSRWELFEKQAEITRKCRGNANIQYAWLPSSKEAISALTIYGLGYSGPASVKSRYGTGVHMTAASFPSMSQASSASYCDIDEKNVQHIVLCRVITGNVEVIHPGSKQFYPSSNEYDTGVDDLQNPRHYIVWNMNINTHIYPEFVVSFKAPSFTQGYMVGTESKHDASVVTSSSQPLGRLQINRSTVNMENNKQQPMSDFGRPLGSRGQLISDSGKFQGHAASLGSSTSRIPKSPWMPFPMLFTAISKEVLPKDMDLINKHYELFRIPVQPKTELEAFETKAEG